MPKVTEREKDRERGLRSEEAETDRQTERKRQMDRQTAWLRERETETVRHKRN